jgi:mitogen-activated protein kinase 1/3
MASKREAYVQTFCQQQVGYNRFYLDKRYQNLKPIGDGSYGFVASGTDKISGEKVAVKKIRDVFADVVDAKRILRELKLLHHFSKHENIISIYDIMAVEPDTIKFDDIYIVTNLYESDLERIIQSRQVLTDQHFQYFLYQILRALKYVHSANVLHRDLKPSNILVNANCDLGICDFGLARGFDVEGKDTLTEYVVTRWYRAPELLCQSPYYGKGVDIWSVGCIFAELLTHEAFFRGDNPQHQLEVIVHKIGCPNHMRLGFVESQAAMASIMKYANHPPPAFNTLFPRDANPDAVDLLHKMLMFHPEDRVSVEEALAHRYLKDFHGQMEEPVCTELFDFDFERGTTSDLSAVHKDVMSRDEVRLRIFDEVLKYRPAAAAAVKDSLHLMDADAKGAAERRNSGAKAGDAKVGSEGTQYYSDDKAGGDSMDMET